jgi:hypothetical protein
MFDRSATAPDRRGDCHPIQKEEPESRRDINEQQGCHGCLTPKFNCFVDGVRCHSKSFSGMEESLALPLMGSSGKAC